MFTAALNQTGEEAAPPKLLGTKLPNVLLASDVHANVGLENKFAGPLAQRRVRQRLLSPSS